MIEQMASDMGKLDKLVNNDEEVTVKAFGILLFGREKFEKMVDKRNSGRSFKDPTDLLLNGPGPEQPRL